MFVLGRNVAPDTCPFDGTVQRPTTFDNCSKHAGALSKLSKLGKLGKLGKLSQKREPET